MENNLLYWVLFRRQLRSATTSSWVQHRERYKKKTVVDTEKSRGIWIEMSMWVQMSRSMSGRGFSKKIELRVYLSFGSKSPHSRCFPSSLGGGIFFRWDPRKVIFPLPLILQPNNGKKIFGSVFFPS